MPPVIDINVLIDTRNALQAQLDSLAVTIAEAEEQEDALEEQIEDLNSVIAYIQGGYSEITSLGIIANVVAEATVPVTAALEWDALANAENYIWEMSLTPDFSAVTEVHNDPSLLFEVNNLQPGVTYYFRGYATAAGFGNGGYAYANVLVLTQLDEVENENMDFAPGGVSFIGNWDAVENAQKYKIYVNTVDDFDTATQIQEVYETTFTEVNDYDPDTYYFYIVASAPLYLDSEPVMIVVINP